MTFSMMQTNWKRSNWINTSLALACILALMAGHSPVMAQDATQNEPTQQTFVISSSDGYGISECLSAEKSCGQVVADGWCESRGRAQALTFGLAADITAIVGKGSPVPHFERGALLITCAN